MLESYAFQDAFGSALDLEGSPQGIFADAAIARALAVHRNTALNAALEALTANYPVIRALVGSESFGGCALQFIKAHSPTDPRLCFFGEKLDRFLETYAPFAELPYLAEVAGLERLCTEALFAADATALDGAALANGVDPELRLRLHPATRFAAYQWPAVSLWLAHQDGANDDAFDAINWRQEAALVTRPDGALIVTALEPGGIAFLDACAAGASITDAATVAAKAGGTISHLFAALIGAGAFQSIKIRDAHHEN